MPFAGDEARAQMASAKKSAAEATRHEEAANAVFEEDKAGRMRCLEQTAVRAWEVRDRQYFDAVSLVTDVMIPIDLKNEYRKPLLRRSTVTTLSSRCTRSSGACITPPSDGQAGFTPAVCRSTLVPRYVRFS